MIIDQHRVEQELAEQRYRAQQQALVKQVKDQYYGLFKTQSALQTNEESITFYRELSRLVHRYVRDELALAYKAMEADARLARSEFDSRKEREVMTTQSERLNVTLGRDPRTPFRVTGVTPGAESQPNQATAESTASAQRPKIREAQLSLRHAQTGYQITKADYLPDLNLSMRYSRLFEVDFIPDEEWVVGLEFRWEFYDWGRRSHHQGRRAGQAARRAVQRPTAQGRGRSAQGRG